MAEHVDDSPANDEAEELLTEVMEHGAEGDAIHPITLTSEERQRRAGPGACVSLSSAAARLSADRGASVVRAGSHGFVLAGYASTGGGKVYAIRFVPHGHTRPIFSERLTRATAPRRLPRVPPGLDVQGDRALLTWVDGDHLRGASLSLNARRGAHVLDLGEGADARFSPAVAVRARGSLVAYTDGSATPMHVRLVKLSLGGDIGARSDLTPPQLGAAAPTFAAGADSPRLYFLEPRSGVSALYRVDFDADLVPSAATLVRPIRNVYEPPRIAIGEAAGGLVAYSALGNGATTAIGLLPLGDANASPVALLRGSGFGLFGLDAAALHGAELFVFGAPAEENAGNAAPHEIRVRLANPAPRASLTFGKVGGTESPSVAVGRDGMIALTYAAAGGVYLRWLSCTPSG